MHYLFRNAKWDTRDSTLVKPDQLPKSFLVKNAVSEAEARSSALIHFDAEIDEADVSLITNTDRVDVERIVSNA